MSIRDHDDPDEVRAIARFHAALRKDAERAAEQAEREPVVSGLPTPKWIIVLHRASGSPSVYFGPFATLSAAHTYADAHGVHGTVIPLHPPVDDIDWEGSALRRAAERSLT